MSRIVTLAKPADFEAWRHKARTLLLAGAPPGDVLWRLAGDAEGGDLFAALGGDQPGALASRSDAAGAGRTLAGAPRVPRAFLEQAKDAICHRLPSRFDLLYRLLWRLRAEPGLIQVVADADVHQLTQLVKAVRRDKHKMTAFVRFREVATEDGAYFLAWFEPEHHILEAITPFFVRRFAGMRWSILTPDGSVHWNGSEVLFGPAASRSDVPADDALEHHWCIYYSSIFNPARLNTQAMKREMPVRYWHNMPETRLIPGLVKDAARRTTQMIEASAGLVSPAEAAPGSRTAFSAMPPVAPLRDIAAPAMVTGSLDDIARGLGGCRRCELWRCASRPVPGEGPVNAAIVMVGEQPGDQEDLAGRPFVGPAGAVLDEGLGAAGLPREGIYLTNAVKHFKFLLRGKRRLHQSPDRQEIERCRWWLQSELALVRPKLIVALGATAAASLLGSRVKVSDYRGRWLDYAHGAQLLITVHPSYLLRLKDPRTARLERQRFIGDLMEVREKAAALGLAPDPRRVASLPKAMRVTS